jgi:signal transduction histidine kinase
MDTFEKIEKRGLIRRILKGVIHFFYVGLLESRSNDEDNARREFIINVIFLSSSILLFVCSATALLQSIRLGNEYDGVLPEVPFIIFLLFCFLFVLSRSGFFVFSAYLLIFLYFIATTYTAYYWGVDVPQVLVSYALIIVISGVLIGTRFLIFVTCSIAFFMILGGYLQVQGVIDVDSGWRISKMGTDDAIEYAVTLVVIAIVSWLYKREIGSSLERARESERALKKERDMLEERVRVRTKELQRIQYEKARQLCRLAEFGRLSSGLFHDLSNYIHALLLNMRKIDPKSSGVFSGAKEDLDRVETTMRKVDDFVSAINRQLSWQESAEVFSVSDEVKMAIQVVAYRAIKNNVEIFTDFGDKKIYIYGNSIKFNQILINILVNAIDAYKNISDKRRRKIKIVTRKKKGDVFVFVEDWACGIPESISSKIFDPFFTTKKTYGGVGIGLSNVKEIIEKSFGGEIDFESHKGRGTKFKITLNEDFPSDNDWNGDRKLNENKKKFKKGN